MQDMSNIVHSVEPAEFRSPVTDPLGSGHGVHLALFISGLSVGGVERTMLALAHEFAVRGYQVDLLVAKGQGFFQGNVSSLVRLIDLEPRWMKLPLICRLPKRARSLLSAPAVARYLRGNKPHVLMSASHYVNIGAIWGRELAATETPLIIRQCTNLSQALTNTKFPTGRRPFLGWMVRRFFPQSNAIVTVSDGVADDLSMVASIPRHKIQTIYNPVVTPDVENMAAEPVDHPWFAPGAPPVVLGVGRLAVQKDFPTLIRAFAKVRALREARLIILGEGKIRKELEELAISLGVREDIDFPGFQKNPFSYMSKASVFVLSSLYEGLPGVLIQAMACGCPVVSTNCPSGPMEILKGGEYGPLVPVGDVAAMAAGINDVLNSPRDKGSLIGRASDFSMSRSVGKYENLFSSVCGRSV